MVEEVPGGEANGIRCNAQCEQTFFFAQVKSESDMSAETPDDVP